MQFSQFVDEHGRVPLLSKGEKPWQYEGWLLWYVQHTEMLENGEDSRWRYYFQMRSWLDPAFAKVSLFPTKDPGPIPKITFTRSEETATHLKDVFKAFSTAQQGSARAWGLFEKFLQALAYGLSVQHKQPDGVSEAALEALYTKLNAKLIVTRPYDYLGAWIADSQGGWNPNAFFPTPHPVVECMTQIMFHDERQFTGDTRFAKTLDPCVGSGRMLLHASNFSLCLYGQDIDGLMCLVTQINGAFYVPWMAFPFPEAATEAKRPVFKGSRKPVVTFPADFFDFMETPKGKKLVASLDIDPSELVSVETAYNQMLDKLR